MLVLVRPDHTPPGVQRITDHLGYIPTVRARHSSWTFRTDADWGKKLLHTLPLGTLIDAEVDTADGPIKSTDCRQIVNVLEAGGDIFFVTFACAIHSRAYKMIYTIYRRGQLTLFAKRSETP